MSLLDKVNDYFKNSIRKRRNNFFIKKEPFWDELENEINYLNINKDWNMDRKIWHFINNTNEIPKCSVCKIEDSRWQYYKNDYGFCSRSCAGSQSLKTRAKDTGFSNPFQSEKIKEKSKKTLLEKYGVDNISKLESIKLKKEETMFRNYGRTNNMGVNCEIMAKNMVNKYGVKWSAHLQHLADDMQFNRFKKRNLLITPSGKRIFLQGYEVNAYNILIDEGYMEDDILYRKIDMPKIMYHFEDKERRYYPDFYIKSNNLIIEVKCKYTYEIDKEKNDTKFLFTKKLGYNHRLMIL
jgi:hypothetical protein